MFSIMEFVFGVLVFIIIAVVIYATNESRKIEEVREAANCHLLTDEELALEILEILK